MASPDDSDPAPQPADAEQTPVRASVTESAPEARDAEEMTAAEAWRVARKMGPAGPLALVAMFLPILGLATVGAFGAVAGDWLKAQEAMGIFVFVLAGVMLCGLAVVPTHAMSALSGFVFAFVIGLPIALTVATLASLLAYVLARRIVRHRVVDVIAEHPKWAAVHAALCSGSFSKELMLVTLVRLPPNSPFALANLVMASANVAIGPYLLGTLLGMAPRLAVVVFLGTQLQTFTPDSEKPWWMLPVGLGLTIAVFFVLWKISTNALARVTANHRAESEGAQETSQPAER